MIFHIVLDDKINESAVWGYTSPGGHFRKHVLMKGEKADIDNRGLPYKNKDADKDYIQRVFNRISRETYIQKATSLADTIATAIIFPKKRLNVDEVTLGHDRIKNELQQFAKLRLKKEPIVFTADETSDGLEHSLPEYVEFVCYGISLASIAKYNHSSPKEKEEFKPERQVITYFIMSPDDPHIPSVFKRCKFSEKDKMAIPDFELAGGSYQSLLVDTAINVVNKKFGHEEKPKEEPKKEDAENKLRIYVGQFLKCYKEYSKLPAKYVSSQTKDRLNTRKKQITDLLEKHPELQELMKDPVGNKLANANEDFLKKFNVIIEQLKRKDNIKKQIKEALKNRKK